MKNRNELIAYEKGYRIVNSRIINPNGVIINGYVDSKGYHKFNLRILKTFIKVKVHRLVAYQKFGDVIFQDDIMVRHLDGNTNNNHESNIMIGSASDNRMDMPKEQRVALAKNAASNLRKLSDEQILELQNLHIKGHKMSYLMCLFNIKSKGSFSNYLNKKIIT